MMSRSTVIAVVLAAMLAQVALAAAPGSQVRCQALVLQAGGDLGAFEIGALQGMLEVLPKGQVEYDVISGISVGSINAIGIAQFPKGDEAAMIDQMKAFWLNVTQSDIMSNYKGGIAQGIIFEKGLFSTENERILLTENVKTRPHRKLNIGACNLRTGQLDRFDETQSDSDIIESVMCSSAFPGVFPYQTYNDNIYVDGGTVQLLDFPGAIQKCREIVSDDSLIDIDAIFVQHATEIQDWEGNLKKKTLEVTTRSNNIQNFSKTYREYIEAKMLFPEVNFRHVIRPLTPLPNPKFPFAFNHDQIQGMIDQGYSNSKEILAKTNLGAIPNEETYEKDAYELYLEDIDQVPTAENKQKLQNFFKNSMSAYEKLKKSL